MSEVVLHKKDLKADASTIDPGWDIVIKPKGKFLDLQIKEIWRYRDLLIMFVKRDIVTLYKQTILGPIWFIVQPIMTTLIYLLIFGKIAGISTGGVPPILFYLSGITMWNFFSDSFNQTSKTFKDNENIFGKVYFPRMIMPLSKILSGMIKFFIQFMLFVSVYAYYLIKGYDLSPNISILTIPAYIAMMAFLGLGAGVLFTSLTTKYRDLTFLIQFGVQLLMYVTPIIYPRDIIPDRFKIFIDANPITPIIEGFRSALIGGNPPDPMHLLYSATFTVILLFFGTIVFNRTEKTFMDTV